MNLKIESKKVETSIFIPYHPQNEHIPTSFADNSPYKINEETSKAVAVVSENIIVTSSNNVVISDKILSSNNITTADQQVVFDTLKK